MEETFATIATEAVETVPTVVVEVVETTSEVFEQIYTVTESIAAKMPEIAQFMQISVNLIVLGICAIGLTAGIILGARLWRWLK